MKKRITAFLLGVLLLTGSAYAAAGGSGDPLITRSYLSDTFTPQLRSSLAAIADRLTADYQRRAAAQSTPAVKNVTLHAGESLHLTQGMHFVMTSGTATLSVSGGTAVNATQGWETSGGAARIGNRYIFCESAEGWLDANTDAGVTVSYGAQLGVGCPFTDVSRSAWYASDVMNAYARGLVNGMTATTYAPGGNLTFAQAIKLAACMHQLYHRQSVTLENSAEDPWYRSYADYALENGVIDAEPADYNQNIDRRSFVQIFYRALPASSYNPRNIVTDGSIPDVTADADGAAEIYAFYRAGILGGYSNTPGYAEHAFGPGSTINRAEVAAIMNRMFDKTARLTFTLE